MNDTLLPPGGAQPDGFGDRLAAGLHRTYDPLPVDVTALRAGAHAGSRRLRRRRAAGIALVAAATIAVPTGVVAALSSGPDRTRGVLVATGVDDPGPSASATASPELTPTPTATASGPSASPEPTGSPTSSPSSTAVATGTPTPAASATPSGSASRTSRVPAGEDAKPSARPVTVDPDDPESVAYVVPDAVAVPVSAFPVEVVLGFDSEQYRYQPTVSGQGCGGAGVRPVAGRQWMWYSDSGDFSVTEVVTGWAPGTGADRLADVRDDTGRCRWTDDQTVLTVTEDRWIGVEQRGKLSFARGAALVGDVIVSLEVQHPGGLDDAEALLRTLLEKARQRVAATW